MNVNEVPQDPLHYKDRDKLRKLMYATDKDGKYTGVNSAGWEAENTATQQAWEEVEDELSETVKKIQAGELSPLAYFMQKNLMDVALLAKYAGKWQWQVKKHMKPAVFEKLNPAMLAVYARIFNITVAELTGFGKQAG